MDRRVIKTKQAIRTAFLDLLADKPIAKITVSEITKRANIGRGTFYFHYTDVYDLYEQTINDTIADLISFFDVEYPYAQHESFDHLFKDLLAYIAKERYIFLIYIQHGMDNQVLNKVKEVFKEKILNEEKIASDNIQEQVEVLYTIHGVMGILVDWLTGKLEVTESELSDSISTLLKKMEK